MADRAAVRQCLWAGAALCCLCLCLQLATGGAQSTGGGDRTPATGGEPSPVRPVAGQYALLVGQPLIALYTPLDSGATAVLLNDTEAVPLEAACAYFNRSVYCVRGYSVKTWRFDHVGGSPLPPGHDLNRDVHWPGSGRLAAVNGEWLVTCGDWRSYQRITCQVLHVNASQWVVIESEVGGVQSAIAEHKGSAFVVGGWFDDRGIARSPSAAVWSLRVSRTADGNDTFQWQRHPDMNTPRKKLAIASHKGYLYACGGYDKAYDTLSDCERWHEGMHSWQSIAPLPEPRRTLHLLSVDGHLIAMGGRYNYNMHSLDVFDYNEAEDTWSRLHDMPDMQWFGSAVVPAL